MIFKSKGFKTLIITRKTLIFIICLVIVLITAVSVVKTSPGGPASLSAKDPESVLLSSAVRISLSDNISLARDALKKIIGFSFDSPVSFLSKMLPMQEKPPIQPDTQKTPSPETPPPSPPPKTASSPPVEEINSSKGVSLNNISGKDADINALISSGLSFSFGAGPAVLIVHTHTTESYSGEENEYPSSADRSTDPEKNVVAVGNMIAEALENAGIEVVHDTTVHDYPAYNGSYERCKATVIKNLEKYPSLKIVLDIHRDGIVRTDGTKVKVVCTQDGEKTAQCMFVVGSNANLKHDNWQENLKLASKLQQKAEELYPGLMRPIILREERFNQQLSPGMIIIEVGSNGNSLTEAKRAGSYMGCVLAALINENR